MNRANRPLRANSGTRAFVDGWRFANTGALSEIVNPPFPSQNPRVASLPLPEFFFISYAEMMVAFGLSSTGPQHSSFNKR
jgi:hypothetical protein